MNVNRNGIELLNKFIKEYSKDIEESIYNFSIEYVEANDTPYLLQSIYDNKINEILSLLKENKSIVSLIKDKKLDVKKIAFMTPDELNPELYEQIIKKKQLEEHKKNNIAGSTAFTCVKCKKSRTSVYTKQTRSGDEPPTVFVTCLECGHTFRFN